MDKNLASLIIGIFFSIGVYAQHPNIKISTTNGVNEPSICIDPTNPQRIVAGSNLNRVYMSEDGGYTWSDDKLKSTYGVWGDPCVVADTAGNFYFFHLSNPPLGSWIDRIVCQKYSSPDKTWSDGSFTGLNGIKNQDKHWACVNPKTNSIYVTWTQFDNYESKISADSSRILFSKSLDNGLTWSNPSRINKISGDCLDSDNTVEGAVPTVGPNGQLYVSWAGPDGIRFDKSLDDGQTWLNEDILVDSQPGGWDMTISGINRTNGMPVTDCDRSGGAYQGTIYINWADQRNGITNTDIWFSKSTNGGLNWSDPIKVNDDDTNRQQFFTWMTVDQVTGFVWVVFYDRRNTVGDATEVYMAVSKDGGSTFENFKVSEQEFTPKENIFFGDYTNVSAVNNVVRPIWTYVDSDGNSNINTAIIQPVLLGIYDPEVQHINSTVLPNPTNGNITLYCEFTKSSNLIIEILDSTGKNLLRFKEGKQDIGKFQKIISLSNKKYASGQYFILIKDESTIISFSKFSIQR